MPHMEKDMELKKLEESGRILYSVVAGSIAYGTNNANSDVDLRGIFWTPTWEHFSFNPPPPQIGNEKSDIVYYSLYRFIELLRTANPNIVELLWMPQDTIRLQSPILNPLFENRKKFITKKAYVSHAEYARAQIGKAKGQNKWINNPKPKEPPTREQFCYVISFDKFAKTYFGVNSFKTDMLKRLAIQYALDPHVSSNMPFRPKRISDLDTDAREKILNNSRVAALEHVLNTYRLYEYKDSKLFTNGSLVPASIPMDDEWKNIKGLLVYSEAEYQSAKKDHENYWTWVRERNPNRWLSQERGEISYDAKNMSHCMRLMLSSKNILENGEPIVRFEGADLQMLRDIREGKWEYDAIMAKVNALSEELKWLYEKTELPEEVDIGFSNDLLKEITLSAERS